MSEARYAAGSPNRPIGLFSDDAQRRTIAAEHAIERLVNRLVALAEQTRVDARRPRHGVVHEHLELVALHATDRER